MTRKSLPCTQESNSLDGEKAERARILAAFMGLLVEQSIKKIDLDQIGTRPDASLAQLREELGATIATLTAQVEEIYRLALADENIEMAERALGLAMLLASVLRSWLDGEDADLTRTMSALERAGAWAAPRGLPRAGLPHSGRCPAPAATAPGRRGHGRGTGPRRDLLQTGITQVSRFGTKRGAAPSSHAPHESSSYTLMRPKRPLDTNQLGKWIVDLSTGVAADDHPAVEFRVTESARRGGLKGGKARAAALTPQRRREIAQLAARQRWKSPDENGDAARPTTGSAQPVLQLSGCPREPSI
jgi:hypothetical protein